MNLQVEYKKIPYVSAEQILPLFTPSEDIASVITNTATIRDVINELEQQSLYFDLVQFLAHALPVREALLWSYLCVEIRHDVWSTTQGSCLAACKQWIFEPSEEARRRCELFANRLELQCAPSWLAQGVFWNGAGSIVSPELPNVLPDPKLYAKACSGAINMAAAMPEWSGQLAYYKQAVKFALNIANGGLGNE
ncbi:DUF6931 family protein [Vibrio cionasavignyae]|uniref:DUF6931 family protein n=1 Tax=Vibrio cionasavignyae TaxID=2910252 RepID=UPI003D128787